MAIEPTDEDAVKLHEQNRHRVEIGCSWSVPVDGRTEEFHREWVDYCD